MGDCDKLTCLEDCQLKTERTHRAIALNAIHKLIMIGTIQLEIEPLLDLVIFVSSKETLKLRVDISASDGCLEGVPVFGQAGGSD